TRPKGRHRVWHVVPVGDASAGSDPTGHVPRTDQVGKLDGNDVTDRAYRPANLELLDGSGDLDAQHYCLECHLHLHSEAGADPSLGTDLHRLIGLAILARQPAPYQFHAEAT